jgi:hypothetical protein
VSGPDKVLKKTKNKNFPAVLDHNSSLLLGLRAQLFELASLVVLQLYKILWYHNPLGISTKLWPTLVDLPLSIIQTTVESHLAPKAPPVTGNIKGPVEELAEPLQPIGEGPVPTLVSRMPSQGRILYTISLFFSFWQKKFAPPAGSSTFSSTALLLRGLLKKHHSSYNELPWRASPHIPA